MGGLLNKLFSSKKERRILMVGLDAAGKVCSRSAFYLLVGCATDLYLPLKNIDNHLVQIEAW